MFRRSRFALLFFAVALAVSVGLTRPARAGSNRTTSAASSTLGQYPATFAGPAATGCDNYGCSSLTGPFFVPSLAASASTEESARNPSVGSGVHGGVQSIWSL
jgi:hypothetical protein